MKSYGEIVMKQKKIIIASAALCVTVIAAIVLSVVFFNKRSDPVISAKQSDTDLSSATSETARSNKILEKCPYTLSDNAEWKFYPSDNLLGFVALAKDLDETDQTYILVFSHSPEQEGADNVIINGKLDCQCFYDLYEFDNQDISEQGNLYYMKMKCDKRIVLVSFGFNLENGDLRDYIRVEFFGYDSVPKMKLYYSHFDYSSYPNPNNIKKEQLFNDDTGSWEDVEDIKETNNGSFSYYKWTELQVYENSPHSVTSGDVTVSVISYKYTHGTYNVYQEPKDPPVTTICVSVSTTGKTGVEDIKDFDINNIKPGNIKLYVKEGDEYMDITPGDFGIETESSGKTKIAEPDVWIESGRFINIKSNKLGELGEKEYMLVFEGYTIHFTLKVQTFEEW